MNSMLKYFKDYFHSIYLVQEVFKSTEASLLDLFRPVHNLIEQLRLCYRAQLADNFLATFPDVKERLLGKIQSCLEEEMVAIIKLEENIKTHLDKLKTQLNSIEKTYEKNEETQEEFNALIPSHEVLLELAIDSWKIVHILWLGIKTSLESINYFDEDSIKQVTQAFAKHHKMKAHFENVADLTRFLRSS